VLTATVTDDGKGGANASRGTGLRGSSAGWAFDGKLILVSLLGGPTKATVEIPCRLDSEPLSPRTNTSSESA
jgi:hypothetical protein